MVGPFGVPSLADPDPERAALLLVLLAFLTAVPALMGKAFLVNHRGWRRRQARLLAATLWLAAVVAAGLKLLG